MKRWGFRLDNGREVGHIFLSEKNFSPNCLQVTSPFSFMWLGAARMQRLGVVGAASFACVATRGQDARSYMRTRIASRR